MYLPPGPDSAASTHATARQSLQSRWRRRLLAMSVLFLILLWPDHAAETAHPETPAAERDIVSTQSAAAEASRWQSDGAATLAAAPNALTINLPAQAEAAVHRDFAADQGDWRTYPSLQLGFDCTAAGHLQLTLTDAAGHQYTQVFTLSNGFNRKQVILKTAAATIDAGQIRRLTLGSPPPTKDTPLTARTLTLKQISLGTELSGIAEEIQNAWYFYYLSRYGYLAFFLILMAISFGVPLPEEIFHLSAGYLAYLTKKNPEVGINVHIIAPINMFSTLIGDCFIYWLGRAKGDRIRQWRWFKWVMPDAAFVKVRSWFDRYGVGATFMFRFLPPIRMPGYFASGLLRQSPWAFFAADGLACLISVPTQIYLVYFYGDWIIEKIKEANFTIAIVAGVLVVAFVVYKLATRKKRAAQKAAAEALMHSPEAEAAIADHRSATGIPVLDGADASHIHIKHLKKEGSENSPGANPPPPPAAP